MKTVFVGLLVIASISSIFCQVYSNKPCPTDRPVQEDFNITRVSFIQFNFFVIKKKESLPSDVFIFLCPTFFTSIYFSMFHVLCYAVCWHLVRTGEIQFGAILGLWMLLQSIHSSVQRFHALLRLLQEASHKAAQLLQWHRQDHRSSIGKCWSQDVVHFGIKT